MSPAFYLNMKIKDIVIGFKIARFEINSRYARSVIGPFWIVLQNAIYVFSLALVFSKVFNTPLEFYIPYLAVGVTGWNFFSGSIIDSAGALVGGAAYVKDKGLSPNVVLCQCLARNFIILLHNSTVLLCVLFYFRESIQLQSLIIFVAGFLIFLWVTTLMVMVIGKVSARFHDLKPIVESGFTLLFLGTPITWMVGDKLKDSEIVIFNPVYHLIVIWRNPLLGENVEMLSFIVSIGILCVCTFLLILINKKFTKIACYL